MVSRQDGLIRWFHQGGLSLGWSHQGGLSSGWSHQDGLFSEVPRCIAFFRLDLGADYNGPFKNETQRNTNVSLWRVPEWR